LNYRICDQFYYTLGLGYELSGDIRPAIDTYLKLWWENRDSPFTIVARLKLKQLPYISPTPTSTLTSTASATPAITPTKTPTPTGSSIPTVTLTQAP
jgi:hypothetical protein